MKLVIVRHAVAKDKVVFAETGRPDSERPLTRRGQEKMKKAAYGLKKQIGDLERLATSPFLRATQTADILRKAYPLIKPIELKELTPSSSPGALLPWLKKQKKESTVAIVGHEPSLGVLIGWLLTGQEKSFVDLKKGGVCLLEFSGGVVPGKAVMRWLLKPSVLRKC